MSDNVINLSHRTSPSRAAVSSMVPSTLSTPWSWLFLDNLWCNQNLSGWDFTWAWRWQVFSSLTLWWIWWDWVYGQNHPRHNDFKPFRLNNGSSCLLCFKLCSKFCSSCHFFIIYKWFQNRIILVINVLKIYGIRKGMAQYKYSNVRFAPISQEIENPHVHMTNPLVPAVFASLKGSKSTWSLLSLGWGENVHTGDLVDRPSTHMLAVMEEWSTKQCFLLSTDVFVTRSKKKFTHST